MMPSIASNISESTILSRVITRETTMSPSVAKELLQWGFTAEDQHRMAELAAKARAGTLTAEEQVEIDEYEQVSSLLGLVKSKARRSLQQVSSN
ncbi:MAG TPA: hypothetical protein PLX97_13220 [Gemmatales bacterium]|nr:hypothetical protein [Gemmatales bacterium]